MNPVQQAYKKKYDKKAFVNLRPLLGYFNWATFLFLIGGAQTGKSYSILDFYLHQYVTTGTPFTWFRLTDSAIEKLLKDNASDFIDPDLARRYNLDLKVVGNKIYECKFKTQLVHKKNGDIEEKQVEIKDQRKLVCRVMSLSTYYKMKGVGLYDKDYDGWYNVGFDEMQPEPNERRTFDIVSAFVRSMENLVRATKNKVRVIGACNLLEEASEILSCFNFIPEKWGIYSLVRHKKELVQLLQGMNSKDKRIKDESYSKYGKLVTKDKNYFGKRAVIYFIEPTNAYKEMRAGSIADILLPNASMYSNKQDIDYSLVDKRPLVSPLYVIKFAKDKDKWFTVWDHNIITKYNGEKKPVVPMRPYLDETYIQDRVKNIILQFDTRSFHFRNLITFKLFQKELELLKPRS